MNSRTAHHGPSVSRGCDYHSAEMFQRKSLGQASWCDREILWVMRLMHERLLFGGRVRVERLGGEPDMRAERVRFMRSSAAAVEAAVRVPSVPFRWYSAVRLVGMHAPCMTERSVRGCMAMGP